MAPPAPKRPSRPRPAIAAAPKAPPRRRPTEELPFDDGEVLNAARMQTEVRPVPKRPEQEAIPTTVYEISQDEELKPSYDAREVSDPGYKPAFLYVEKGPGQGQLLPVKQGSLVVGRASVSDLRLQHPSVSRRHAQITRLGERFYLKDLGSQNATYVNKVRIETEIEVYPGDQLQIGQAVLKLRGPAEKIPELAKKQIEKAAAKSARRKPVAEKAPSSGPNKILLGLACAAIGFGLAAVLLFVVINVKNQQPTYQQLPAQQTAAQAAAAEGPAGVSPVAPVAPANVSPAQQQDPVAERIHQEMAKQPEAPAAEAAPEPEPVVEAEPVKVARAQSTASTIARREPRPAVAHKTERTPPRNDEDSEPAAKPGADNAKILKLYEDGDVAAAIAAAKASGDRDLASKLADFQSSYAAGEKAERAGDGTGAIKAYQRALAADEKLSGGWGKHGPEISKKLGNLYTLVGQYYLREDDDPNAKLAFEAALKYDPANATAKNHLAKMGPKKSSRAAAKSAIEDAWDD